VHDVVGHSLAVINMQAGVALHVLDQRPDQAATALRAMRQASAAALADLRVTLAPVDGEPDRRPPPGLTQAAELIAAVRRGGLPVDLHVDGVPPAVVPAPVDLAAYRILQESLTNVVRHAGTCRATVRIRYDADAVVVAVDDDGRGADPSSAGGRGLIGMRERAAAVGGTLHAGPAGGGFQVRATLPITGGGGGTSNRD
jgi:signal transduction histidine kinase